MFGNKFVLFCFVFWTQLCVNKSLLLHFSGYVDASKQTPVFTLLVIVLFKELAVLFQSCFLQTAINQQFCVHCIAHSVQMYAIMFLL